MYRAKFCSSRWAACSVGSIPIQCRNSAFSTFCIPNTLLYYAQNSPIRKNHSNNLKFHCQFSTEASRSSPSSSTNSSSSSSSSSSNVAASASTEKTPPSGSSAETESSQPKPKQYWRTERIIQAIAEQEGQTSASGAKTKSSAQKGNRLVRIANAIVSSLWKFTKATLYYLSHPSKIPPLLSTTYKHFKEEMRHYWLGCKLLAADVRAASHLLREVTRGHSLTRSERRQLTQTVEDLARLVPFLLFVLIPFAELLLPFVLKIFPNILPSTFQQSHKKQEKMKRELQARLNMAQFLQDTLDDMAKRKLKVANQEENEYLLMVLKNIRKGKRLKTDDILRLAKLFDDEFTLENLDRPLLALLCKYLGMPVFGNDQLLRYRLNIKFRSLHKDDQLIAAEGLDNLSTDELRTACHVRGMRGSGLTREGYARNLAQWLDLTLDKKVPESIVFLSRALSINEQPSPADISAVLSSLNEETFEELASAAGIADRELRLAILHRQHVELQAESEKRARAEREKREEEEKEEAEKQTEGSVDVKVIDEKVVTEAPVSAEKPISNESTREEDMASLADIAKGLMSLSSPSAVDEERQRLQALLDRATAHEFEEFERQLVKSYRPDEADNVETLSDLADWKINQLQQSSDVSSAAAENEEKQKEAKAVSVEEEKVVEKVAKEDQKQEDDYEEAQRHRLEKRVHSMLTDLRKRVQEVDEEIGNKLYLLPKNVTRVSENELLKALTQLQHVTPEQAQMLVEKIRALSAEKGDKLEGLSVDEIRTLARKIREDEEASNN